MVLHGRTDAQGGALVPPPVESVHFIWAVGPHMRHEPGGHIAPLAGVVHGGGGRVPCPMAKRDVCHGACSLREVAGPRRKHPSYADCQFELLPCGKPGDPEAQVLGRFLLRLFAGVAGVALQACVVQVPPPPGRGGPRRRGNRLTRGVGGRFHARALTRGVALARSPVRRAARGRLPLARSGNLPQGGVVALEVRLSWYCEGCIFRLVALRLRVDAWRLRCWDRLEVIPAGVHEGIEGVVVAVVSAG